MALPGRDQIDGNLVPEPQLCPLSGLVAAPRPARLPSCSSGEVAGEGTGGVAAPAQLAQPLQDDLQLLGEANPCRQVPGQVDLLAGVEPFRFQLIGNVACNAAQLPLGYQRTLLQCIDSFL